VQARDVNGLRAYLREHQRDYAQLGRLGEPERDRIEGEVGTYVRSCSANIDKLQQMLAAPAAAGGSPARAAAPPNADQLAHRQGQVLILAERLRSAAALFDRLRSLRYQQLQAAEAARLARLPRSGPPRQPQTTGELHAAMRQAAAPPPQAGGGAGGGAAAAAQQQIQLENQALQLELLGMSDQASGGYCCGAASTGPARHHGFCSCCCSACRPCLAWHSSPSPPPPLLPPFNTAPLLRCTLCIPGHAFHPSEAGLPTTLLQVQQAERTVREIATLNQMFSAAITQQGEQIEQLYNEAVQATGYIDRANVQLGKAVRTNKAARKYLLVFFLVASLGLLFLDWWNS
jgi:syntaxin 18